MQDLNQLQAYLRQFAKDRDWDQFHSLDEQQRAAVADEIAEVQMYLARLADKLDINIGEAIEQKIVKSEAKYPADKVKGSSKKYNQYDVIT